MSQQLAIVVLAAGKGTRMRSGLAKVLHPLAGMPLIGHVLATARALAPERIVVVLAPDMDEVAAAVERAAPGAVVVIQDPPLGTGHALQAAAPQLAERGTVLVLYGDTPLLGAATLRGLIELRTSEAAAVAVLGMLPPDRGGYGRLREAAGRLLEIVEAHHADAELARSSLCNAGVMAIDAARLATLLAELPLRAEKSEYYLTDIVAGATARGWTCLAAEAPWQEGVGVNSQAELALVERLFQERRRAELLAAGVVMQAPETVFLAHDTVIEPGAILEPFVVFGAGCRIAAGARIHAFSHLTGTVVSAEASFGPFARARPGARIGRGAKIGNFVEVKAAEIGAGAKVNHLSYVGDTIVGAAANVGAGTVTCNYDGFGKHRTVIGAGAFIGSNTALVAPVEVGDGAVIGAGSTITRDVPADAVALARAEQTANPGGAARRRERLGARRDHTRIR
jgi:bifunctional UDP-N-acetylglucosamine pyrophosphorylase/glucosamine-1-phosphate N-acetyltransferase